ncbi:FGGY family carbohydrate kinase, partial [bacterium]|nr:FGGY family carbohydrate kinase [bacterium]
MTFILAIDQGTTSTRSMIFDINMNVVATDQTEFKQYFPKSGWVEHDPNDLWETTLKTCHKVMNDLGKDMHKIKAIGITNQRETVIVWDKKTGEPIYNAIVWQDRRTADMCEKMRVAGNEQLITDRTGLLLDPYFSSTKLKWILDNIKGARVRAEKGELLFGTVDCFLIWKLTNGKVHATDATNAARTMLYDIRKGHWSKTICDLLDIPMKMLPEVKDCAADFGNTHSNLFNKTIPICGVAGDQQAATIGQACFKPGMMKSTYGTGCFALLNTGDTPVASKNKLL